MGQILAGPSLATWWEEGPSSLVRGLALPLWPTLAGLVTLALVLASLGLSLVLALVTLDLSPGQGLNPAQGLRRVGVEGGPRPGWGLTWSPQACSQPAGGLLAAPRVLSHTPPQVPRKGFVVAVQVLSMAARDQLPCRALGTPGLPPALTLKAPSTALQVVAPLLLVHRSLDAMARACLVVPPGMVDPSPQGGAEQPLAAWSRCPWPGPAGTPASVAHLGVLSAPRPGQGQDLVLSAVLKGRARRTYRGSLPLALMPGPSGMVAALVVLAQALVACPGVRLPRRAPLAQR
jgi:hypothetical protein